VWKRTAGGLTLTFHLAGINNQNFLMRDEETGTFWQQISGRAVSGPLAGSQLEFFPSDEISFGLWRTQAGNKTVLKPVAKYVDEYESKDWDVRMAKVKTVLDFPNSGLRSRDLVLGVDAFGVSRAYPVTRIHASRLMQDQLYETPVLIVLGPDQKSVRVFEARPPGADHPADYYSLTERAAAQMSAPLFMDSATGSTWNFDGCAVSGPLKGKCLKAVPALYDYWFDWRNYHPQTTIFKR
jgi:Protein of unknown function (DUF3179)